MPRELVAKRKIPRNFSLPYLIAAEMKFSRGVKGSTSERGTALMSALHFVADEVGSDRQFIEPELNRSLSAA
jgi:hypothetical protein